MPRLPSLRRPTMDAMKAEVERIRTKQRRAIERVALFEKGADQEDPVAMAKLEALEEAAALTEREVATLEAAAKVGALLERVKSDDPDDDRDEHKTVQDVAEVAARLEQKTPAKVSRGTPGQDDDS